MRGYTFHNEPAYFGGYLTELAVLTSLKIDHFGLISDALVKA